LIVTSKKTQSITIIKLSWLMLFKEILAVYSEDHKKPINTLLTNAELMITNKTGGT
jgi:hypothetical protein